jgi:prolyl oligopeptidase
MILRARSGRNRRWWHHPRNGYDLGLKAAAIEGINVMRSARLSSVAVSLLMASAVWASGDTPADDPFLWLEQVDSPRAMEWVRAENAKTAAVLEKDPHYPGMYKDALTIAQAQDRIPLPSILGGAIYNFWQDEHHAHGLWRRTSMDGYRQANIAWTPVLDLDALSASEKANWFWSGAECAEPAERVCMVELSDGGEDAVTVREFDLKSNSFVKGGFVLPKGKQELGWENEHSMLVGREWSPGELTTSGYPYVIKRLARGEPLSSAREVFRGKKSDVGTNVLSLHDGQGHQALIIQRDVTFFEVEFNLVRDKGLAKLALPSKAALLGLIDGRLLVELREDWKTFDGRTMPQGSVVALDLAAVRAAPDKLKPTLLYEPGARKAFAEARVAQNHLLLAELDNVKGRAYVYTPETSGAWSHRALALPDDATIEIVDTDLHSDLAFLSVTGFLTPSSLWLADLKGGAPNQVKSLPPKFDASNLKTEQLEATSPDGTKVPYFVVHRNDIKLDGSTPTMMTAYGGFQVSETPYYSATTGKLWLERGGAFVLANIRGGGEFGPAWHEAGLKTQRQRIYDDFAAVAKDLIAKGYTSPARLGIKGGSNGGLLMGVEFNQHPELWGAVSIEVPLLDMMRYEQIAAGSSWVGEYGSVSVPEEKAFLATISPYQNLKAGVKYPLPLVWTTTKDDRVGPQHARKFAARLSAMNLPYLYYEVIEGGHGAGATLEEKSAMTAREFVYFARQLSLP